MPAAQRVAISDLKDQEPRFSWKVFSAWVVVVTASMYAALIFSRPETLALDPFLLLFMPPLQGLFAGTIYYGGYVWFRRLAYRAMIKRISVDHIEEEAGVLQQDLEQDFFNNLVKINFKYIDKYYLQTQVQADKAFTMCAIAAFVGFGVVIAGIIQMYIGKVEPAYVTTAAGVASEFVAGVFFYLYTKTIIRMSDYHRKLVLTQNVGLALRITQDLPEPERVKAQVALVKSLSQDINQFLAGDAINP